MSSETAPRFPLLTRMVAVALAIGLPAAAVMLQRPGTEERGRESLEIAEGSAVWFCTEGSTDPGVREGIAVANPTTRSARGRSTVFVGEDRSEPKSVAVPPGSRAGIDLDRETAGRPAGQTVATLIELDVTAAAVAQAVLVDRPDVTGTMAAACTTGTGMSRWFAGGSSLRGADTYLLLFNPFPQDAVVDVVVFTDSGVERPGNLQGLTVFPGRRISVKVSDEVRRKSALGTEVRASRGRVIVQQTVFSNGDRIPAGASLSNGAEGPSNEWYFADGYQASDTAQVFSILNPSDREALVELSLLPEGEVAPPLPVTARVPPNSEITMPIEPKMPDSTRHGSVLRSTNDVPVVADRMLGYTVTRHGLSINPGAPRLETRWLFPISRGGGTRNATFVQSLVLANPGTVPALASIGALDEGRVLVPPELSSVSVPPGRRISVSVEDHFRGLSQTSLMVISDRPIVAESRIAALPPAVGFESVMGIPVPARVEIVPSEVYVAPPPVDEGETSPTIPPATSITGTAPVVAETPTSP